MQRWLLKIVKGSLAVPLLTGGIGIIGVLGVGVATGGSAAAAGPTVGGTYTCAAPLIGRVKLATTIQDLNTAPATLPQGTAYVAQPQVVVTVPASLVKAGHTADPTLTSLNVASATLGITATGFNGPTEIKANNLPKTVPIDSTTETHGDVITLNFTPTQYFAEATTGTMTLTPGNATLNVLLPITCYSPGHTIKFYQKTTTGLKTTYTYTTHPYTVSGSDTLGPIDTITVTPPVKPITRTWEVASDGGIFALGNAKYFGSEGGKSLNAPVVGMAPTPGGGGYWEVASDGGIFAFGNAQYYGSEGGKSLHAPVVGMATTPTGGGYWEVASDGGVFAFGNAQYLGSEGGKSLNAPVVGMAATPTGGGYWEVASDGGIFTFGNAQYLGSNGGISLNEPVVAMAATPTGGGYWEVASDGGIFTFGNAQYLGSEGGFSLNAPVVGMAVTPTGNGYWEVASDGGIFGFGTVRFYGSEGGKSLNAPVVGMTAT